MISDIDTRVGEVGEQEKEGAEGGACEESRVLGDAHPKERMRGFVMGWPELERVS